MGVLFIGGGRITGTILKELETSIEIAYIYDKMNVNHLKDRYHFVKILRDFNVPNDVECVVEAASIEAVKEYSEEVLKSGKDYVILSSGAFADIDFLTAFMKLLETSKGRVFIPSGAIGGLDVVVALSKWIESIDLITRKNPESLGCSVEKETEIFSGSVLEAIERFPKNINVAVTLALAAKSFEKVRVKIMASPGLKFNEHNVRILSRMGEYEFILRNKPLENQRTSLLAALSTVTTLRRLKEKFVVGV